MGRRFDGMGGVHDGGADRVDLWRARAGVRVRVWGAHVLGARLCQEQRLLCVRSRTTAAFGHNADTMMSLFLEGELD